MAITPVNLSASLFKSLRSVDAGEKATATTAVKLATGLKVDSSSNSDSFALAQQLRGKIQNRHPNIYAAKASASYVRPRSVCWSGSDDQSRFFSSYVAVAYNCIRQFLAANIAW